MRVLHIDTEKGFRGGEGQVLALARGLRARGVAQLILARKGAEFARRARQEGFDVTEVAPLLPAWLAPPVLWRRALHGFAPDIVHAHTGNGLTVAVRAFSGQAPIVETRRVDFPIKPNRQSRSKYLDPNVTHIAISNAIRRVLAEIGIPDERLAVVPSGVDPERFRGATGRGRVRAEWGVGDAPVFGTVGAYVDHKDSLALVEATPLLLQDLPDARVVFVGEGELRPAMEERIAALGLGGSVTLTGWRDDVGDCLAALDIFVLPSKLEGLCTSLLDAQAVGLPCVACAAGGVPDIVRPGENGLLVPPRNPPALASAMVELWNNQEMRGRFAKAGPRIVEAAFTVDRMVQGTLAVYQSILRRHADA